MSTADRELIVVEDAAALAEAAAARLLACIDTQPERVAICLTGGSTPKALYELLATPAWRPQFPWPRIDWFIGDERCVPQADANSNFGMARRAFLDACAPASNMYPIPSGDPHEAAATYATILRERYGSAMLEDNRPMFDVVLMGIGPDGHTASLFPKYAAMAETEKWAVDVPETPVAPFLPRVTLTMPVLASCREMLFLVSGRDKRGVVTRALADDTLPASRAHSRHHTVWLMDRGAAPERLHGHDPCALIVMGVSGSGKSTIAEALAKRLNWLCEDGDRYHPKANVEKMSAGRPLTDTDRIPWLQAIAARIDTACEDGGHLVISCSALKRSYRNILVHGRTDVRLVYLEGSKALIADRLAERKNHFMPAGLLDSQFDALEPPGLLENAIVVSIDAPVEAVVDRIVRALRTDMSR